jgi:hypothetical protein
MPDSSTPQHWPVGPPPPPSVPPPPPQTQPPGRRWYDRRGVQIGIAAFVGLVALGAIAGEDEEPDSTETEQVALAEVGSSPEEREGAGGVPTVEPAEAPAVQDVVTTLPPPPPAPPTTSVDGAMAAWANDNLHYTLELGELFNDIAADANSLDVLSMSSHCRDLGNLVDDIQSDALPVPDAEMNGYLTSALDDFALAASFCVVGADNFDAASLESAATLMASGSDSIHRATARMEEIG